MLDENVLRKIGESFFIPPRPDVLLAIQEIAAQPEPDVNALVRAVTSDVALSGAVLKTLNSPAVGLRMQIDNIHQATMLLGVNKVMALATGFLVRRSFAGRHASISLDEFWDSSQQLAEVNWFIGDRTDLKRYVPLETLYTLGLFCNAGKAAMAIRYPDYADTLALSDAQPERRLVDIEDERYHTDHGVVGFLLARNWGLPRNLLSIILCHAREDFFSDELPLADRMAMAALLMARAFRYYWKHWEEAPFWRAHQDTVTELLGLHNDDVLDLREDVEAKLQH